jgi:hypothetical protein
LVFGLLLSDVSSRIRNLKPIRPPNFKTGSEEKADFMNWIRFLFQADRSKSSNSVTSRCEEECASFPAVRKQETNWPTSCVLVSDVSNRSTFLSVMSVQNTERWTKTRKHTILKGVLF